MARLKIYTDENVGVRIAKGLKRRGIKAFSTHEKAMIGASDIEHFKYASKTKAVILRMTIIFRESLRNWNELAKITAE